MSEELVKYETHKTNSLTDIVQIGAWSGAPEGGYQFTFQIDWEKWEDYKGDIASHEKHTPKDAWHIMNSLVWFSLSGKQIEDLYLMHLERKIKGLESMDRVKVYEPVLVDLNGDKV
tara:strand:+ start:240 stop:587 length:348 start_codon:yes stop_codon:yes gene_type:complete